MDNLKKRAEIKSMKLKIGLYDDPENQTQDDLEIDLFQNNLAVFGSAMSGKTTLLKTILIRIHQVCGLTDKEEIYILDSGSNLSKYEDLPYVVACFDATNDENVRRIFRRVENRLEENKKKLGGDTYLHCGKEMECAHVTFMIDGLNSFLSEDHYSAYRDMLQRIARDGLSKGVTVIFTANEPAGGVNKLLPSFKNVVALDLPKDSYTELFGHRVEKPISEKGRGIVSTKDGIFELQAYYPFRKLDEAGADELAIQEIVENLAIEKIVEKLKGADSPYIGETLAADAIEKLEKRDKAFIDSSPINEIIEKYRNEPSILYKCKARKMKAFTEDLTKNTWVNYTNESWKTYQNSLEPKHDELYATVGLDYYTLNPVRIDLKRTRAIAIYGKKNFGKTNLLSLILEAALRDKHGIPRIIVLEDARKSIEDRARGRAVWNVFDKYSDLNVSFVYSPEDFFDLLRAEQYYDAPESVSYVKSSHDNRDRRFWDKPHTFSLFVVQSRMFYQATAGAESTNPIPRISDFVANESTYPKLFVFSDVQRITEPSRNTIFNSWIDHAFLLDDALRFVHSSGGQKSVFESQDIDDLRENYGKCEVGDGFYLNVGSSELTKLRFIKQEETRND